MILGCVPRYAGSEPVLTQYYQLCLNLDAVMSIIVWYPFRSLIRTHATRLVQLDLTLATAHRGYATCSRGGGTAPGSRVEATGRHHERVCVALCVAAVAQPPRTHAQPAPSPGGIVTG